MVVTEEVLRFHSYLVKARGSESLLQKYVHQEHQKLHSQSLTKLDREG